jgi:peptidoglycan/xylan/chitin deacetylase (PgdA/CDA1 family)
MLPNGQEPRLCSVSVDVDGIEHYRAIHGLGSGDGSGAELAHTLGVQRLCDWAAALELPLTWFVIARDTYKHEFVQLLQSAIAGGHEVGNHTLDHRYDLVRLPREQQRVQVERAQDALEHAFGARPIGFRAPGYTIDDGLIEVLEAARLQYDSSVFPCPAYYGAKALVLLMQKLQARRSSSILDNPRVLAAPTEPYRCGRPYTRRGQGLVEVPIQVTPGLRLPFIGTMLTLAGPDWARRFARSLLGVRLVNLELHAIDLLSEQDGLGDLAPFQSDLRRSVAQKTAALTAAMNVFKAAGYRFVTLANAVRELAL